MNIGDTVPIEQVPAGACIQLQGCVLLRGRDAVLVGTNDTFEESWWLQREMQVTIVSLPDVARGDNSEHSI
jgi:hypothetical protein